MEEREVKLEVQKAKANEEEDDGEWELQNLGVEGVTDIQLSSIYNKSLVKDKLLTRVYIASKKLRSSTYRIRMRMDHNPAKLDYCFNKFLVR